MRTPLAPGHTRRRAPSPSGVDGEIEPDPEQLLLAAGEAGGELTGIGGGDLDVGVDQPPFGGVGPPARFEAGHLSAQPVRGHTGRDRLDLHGDVEATGMGGERLQPAEPDLTGVADDGEARHQPSPTRSDRGPTSMASGPNGDGARVAGRGMRAQEAGHRMAPFLVSGRLLGAGEADGLFGPGQTRRSKRCRRVEGATQALRRAATVEGDEGHPRTGESSSSGAARRCNRPAAS